METECHNEQKVPDSFFMKFKRTHGTSQFAKGGIWTGYKYLSTQRKGAKSIKLNWEQTSTKGKSMQCAISRRFHLHLNEAAAF